MIVEYKRELNHNYLKIEAEEKFFEYQIQMLSRNNIDGLLSCNKECVNNKTSFLYEINSKQPFVQVFQRSKITIETFKLIINCIKNVVENMADYMLDVNSVLLNPEYMYMNPETKVVELIYLPGAWSDIKNDFHELSRRFLDWIDYSDKKVVASAYELYRQTGEENYTLTDILNVLFFDEVNEDNEKEDKLYNYNDDRNVLHNEFLDNKNRGVKSVTDDEDFVFESDVEEDDFVEKSSIIKKITRPVVEAAENLLKNFSSKNKISKNDEEYENADSIKDEWTEEKWTHDKVFSYSRYSDTSEAVSMVSDAGATYGDTVFFQDKRANGSRLIPVDNKSFKIIELTIFPFIIGKLAEAVDGVIDDQSVSRIHCKIERVESVYFIVDLNSTNGTFVNGEMIFPNEKTKLHNGDRIQFGLVEYIFEC